MDTTAAAILAIDRRDLPCLSLVLFGGAATIAEVAGTLELPPGAVCDIVARLELAGFAGRQPGPTGRIELTGHART